MSTPKSPGQGPRPRDADRHQPASDAGQKPPTDANPTRMHYQHATEGLGGLAKPPR